jgi:hypothetical protein
VYIVDVTVEMGLDSETLWATRALLWSVVVSSVAAA